MSFEMMMARIPLSCTRARELLQALQEYDSHLFLLPENIARSYAFRVFYTNHNFGISISCPPDVSYDCYEIALCNTQGSLFYNEELGYDDVCRFDTVREVFEEILRIEGLGLPSL